MSLQWYKHVHKLNSTADCDSAHYTAVALPTITPTGRLINEQDHTVYIELRHRQCH